MTRALVVGLGRTGVLVLRRLRAIGEILWDGCPPWEVLGIDLSPSGSEDIRDSQFPPLEDESHLYLSGEDARAMLKNLGGWRERIDWVPPSSGYRILEEVDLGSASHYRWLGRLAFLREEGGVVRANLQAALRRLTATGEEAGGAPTVLMVVAALGGGAGSGMLADLGRVLASVAEGLPRLAFMVLPQAGFEDQERSWGNTYGCLRELACVGKSAGGAISSFGVSEDGAPGGRVGWERLYLFSPEESEESPFKKTLERVAWAMAARFHFLLGREMEKEVEHEGRLAPSEEDGQSDGRLFSSCGAICLHRISDQDNNRLKGPPLRLEGSLQDMPVPAPPQAAPCSPPESFGLHGASQCIEEAVLSLEGTFMTKLVERCQGIRARCFQEDKVDAAQSDQELLNIGSLLKIEKPAERQVWWFFEAVGELLRRRFYWLVEKPSRDPGPYALRVSPEALERLVMELGLAEGFQEMVRRCVQDRESGESARMEICEWLDRTAEVDSREVESGKAWGSKEARISARNLAFHADRAEKIFELTDPGDVRAAGEPARRATGVAPKDLVYSLRDRSDAMISIFGGPEFRTDLRREVFRHCRKLMRNTLGRDGKGEGGAPFSSLSPQPQSETAKLSREAEEARLGYRAGYLPVSRSAIKASIWRSRAGVFGTNPSRSEKHAFALVLFPADQAKEEADSLRSFLRRTVQDALQCRVRIIDHSGPELWIYHEDLFHAAADIRHLDRFREAYMRHPRREIFHLDYRLLADPEFEDLLEPPRRELTYCGNRGCRENIASLPRGILICPGCKALIRSRCGNPDCLEDDLHAHPEYRSKTCPRCNGVNRGAWWSCCRHRGAEILIPIDKERCPDCILEHHKDPGGFPLSWISRRPDLRDEVECPHCLSVRKKNPRHAVFTVRYDLLPFYWDGVNGVNRNLFFDLAKRYKLPDGCRCPSCCTFLIPVDRRHRLGCEDSRTSG